MAITKIVITGGPGAGKTGALGRIKEVFSDLGLDPAFYANRRREYGEVLPWDHLNYGIPKKYLIRESEKAKRAETTDNCHNKCAGCGANKLNGGHCDV